MLTGSLAQVVGTSVTLTVYNFLFEQGYCFEVGCLSMQACTETATTIYITVFWAPLYMLVKLIYINICTMYISALQYIGQKWILHFLTYACKIIKDLSSASTIYMYSYRFCPYWKNVDNTCPLHRRAWKALFFLMWYMIDPKYVKGYKTISLQTH